jgi:hypothetical protein
MQPTKAAGWAHNRGGGGGQEGRGEEAERAQARSYLRGQSAHYYVYLMISLEYSSAAQIKSYSSVLKFYKG